MGVVLALDQGTTSSRAILFDRSGQTVGVAQQELTQYYPKPGWVEHDANEIWDSQLAVARQVLGQTGTGGGDVAAIGISNQRETTVLWDRQTGQPIHRAIVWQDRRTADVCDALRADGHSEGIQQKTGLVIDAYLCATKIGWLLDHVEGARTRAERGELAFGTIDSWLIWNLTGGRVHATDVTNASRTMLFNINTREWDEDLVALFDVPPSILPEVQPSSFLFGSTEVDLLPSEIPIGSAAGDQQAALFGQNCSHAGMAKNTYGTGCFALMHVGDRPMASKHRLLSTIACSADEHPAYALEGSVFMGGATVQWLRDGLGIIESAADIEKIASSVADSDGVYLVPAFAGLGAPHWDAYARGTIVGLTRGTNRGHIARAALEGIAFQVADVLDAMTNDAGASIEELRVDGGAAANDLLLQFQADILQVTIVRPRIIETTALGAAFLAGLAVGFWDDLTEIQSLWKAEKVFRPQMSMDEVSSRRSKWTEALKRSRDWEEHA
jgi:glycerol kinase